MEPLLVMLLLFLLSALSSWLQKRAMAQEQAQEQAQEADRVGERERPMPPRIPGERPPREIQHPASPPWRPVEAGQPSSARRWLEKELERREIQLPRPAPAPSSGPPVQTAPGPPAASVGDLKKKAASTVAATTAKARDALGKARQLSTETTVEVDRGAQQTSRQVHREVIRVEPAPEMRLARDVQQLLRRRDTAREAVLASVILGPPKALELGDERT